MVSPQNRCSLDIDRFFPYRLAVLADAVSRHVAPAYEETFGISRQEWRVLAVLGDGQPVLASALRKMTTMDKSSVSRAVRALDLRGLVDRSHADSDRRELSVWLTPAGVECYRKILPQAITRAEAVLADLSPSEKELLYDLLERVQARTSTLAREP